MKKYLTLIVFLVCTKCLFAQTINYSYDNLGRLTQATYPDSSVINYSYDASGNRTFSKIKDPKYHAPQTIKFDSILSKQYGIKDFSPGATASSGLIVSYTSSDTTIATIVNNNIHITGVGETVIIASQNGNGNFSPARNVRRTLVVTLGSQTITFPPFSIKTLADTDFNPGATASSGLPITYQNSHFILGPVELINNKIHIVDTGTTEIIATQSGNKFYQPAPNVIQTLIIYPVPKIIANGSTTFFTGDSVILTASSGTGYKYIWSKNGTDITGATGTTFTASTSGSYTVSIIAGSSRITSAAVTVNAEFTLPSTNFQISATSATCRAVADGSIDITAVQSLSYSASITGSGVNTSYQFTINQTIPNLAAGTYHVCITVQGQANYQQCFDMVITEPKDLSVYSTVNSWDNTLSLVFSGGNIYNIELNGNLYTTSDNSITLPLKYGDNQLSVTTDKLCQGAYQKVINILRAIVPFPDPFSSTLSINLGNDIINNVYLEVHNVADGKVVYSKQYVKQSGVIELDLSQLKEGAYALHITLDNTERIFKIIKK